MISHLKLLLKSGLNKLSQYSPPISQDNPQTVKHILQKLKIDQILSESQIQVLEMTLLTQINEQITMAEFMKRMAIAKTQLQSEANEFIEMQPKQVRATSRTNHQGKSIHKKPIIRRQQPNVELNPEYFRVDLQLAHKIYESYRKLPVGANKINSSFDQREQDTSTMNYHKVIQIFKDSGITLEVQQKLQILRSIKKHCFNQQFINQEEFTKVYKVIIHGMGFKENAFLPALKTRVESQYNSKQKRIPKHKLNLDKNITRKIKTQQATYQSSNKLKFQISKTIQMLQQKPIKMQNDRYYQKLSRIDGNQSFMKNQSMNKPQGLQSRFQSIKDRKKTQTASRAGGYLNRAMDKHKIGKITWETLFSMTEQSMHHHITIPSIIAANIKDTDIYV